MKTSWAIGLILLFAVCQALCGIAQGSSTPIPQVSGATGTFSSDSLQAEVTGVQGADVSNPISAVYSLVSNAWSYCKWFTDALTWNYPEIFQGNFVYFKYFLWAVSVGFGLSIVSMLRGVHSS